MSNLIWKANGFWHVHIIGLRIWPNAADECSLYARDDYIRNTQQKGFEMTIGKAYVITEITKEVFDRLSAEGVEVTEYYWLAKIEYMDGTFQYYKFNEPYNVKVSDFFSTNQEKTIKTITIA